MEEAASRQINYLRMSVTDRCQLRCVYCTYWQEWQKIKSGKAMVAVGTRSAIFAPCKNLGLIIIDSEEASDFKQSDQNPRYDARIAAIELARLTGAKVLLGSQTPRIETYYKTKNSEIKILEEELQAVKEEKAALKRDMFNTGEIQLMRKIEIGRAHV